MVKKARTFVFALLAGIALILAPLVPASAAQPAVTTTVPASVATSLGFVAVPAGTGKKCFLWICIPGGVVKVTSSSKHSVYISDGIDGRGMPYGHKSILRAGQSSKSVFYDTDMVYIPMSWANAGYRIQVLRSYSGGKTVFWQTLSKTSSQHYKLSNGTTLTVRVIKL